MTHEVVLQGYNVKPGSLQLGTFDSYGIEKINVTADDEWAGLDILAVFHAPDGTATKVVAGADGMLAVPPEATAKQAGVGRIVFVGLAENVQRITVDMGYSTKTHSDIEGDNPGVPTPDVVQQILQAALNAEQNSAEANTAAQGAQTAAESAASAAQASAESASKAAAEASSAKPYAESAKASAEAARNSENQAQQSSAEANTAKNAAQNAQAGAESFATAAAKSAKEAAASAVNLNSAANTATQKAAAASASAAAAKASESAAKASESAAASSEAAARKYANSAESAANTAGEAAAAAAKAKTAAESAQADAAASKAAAANSATQANQSANAAANSAIAAKTSEDAAAKSAADADSTANSINASMTQIAANKEAVSQLKEDTTALKKRQNVLVGSETGNPVSCNDAFAAPLCGLTVYGKSTQDGTPTLDAPVPIVSAGDGGSVAVKVTGKNLFPVITNANISTLNKPTGGVRYGYVFHVPAESRVTVSGNANISTNCFVGDFDIKTQTYTQKAQLILEKGGIYAATLQSGWYAVYLANDYLPTILIKLNDAKIQIEIGTKATAYEPYREQLLTLPTPNGLPGIPVTSGGNYTDPQGQQWICDEVDLERGVKVQRVKRVDISSLDKSYWDFRNDTGADTSSTRYKNNAVMIDFKSNAPAMSNILPLGVANIKNTFRLVATPLYLYQFNLDASEFPTVKSWTEYLEVNTVLVIYATVTPIETPLTPAEIAAYKALTAYAPDTVVQASDGAGIKLDYQRDVNLVVKNLEDSIASMTTT